MAVFELTSAAARTRIVATNGSLTCFPDSFPQQAHDFRGRSARLEQLDHRLHVRVDGFEKMFITRAKIVQSRLTVRRVDETILRAFTMAGETNIAFPAIIWQRGKFLTPKCRCSGEFAISPKLLFKIFPSW